MPQKPNSARQIAAEARDWFKTLSAVSVSTGDIWAFAAWFREPENRAAYDRVETRARKAPTTGPFSPAELLAALERRPDLATAYRAAFEKAGKSTELADIAREMAARSEPDRP